MGADDIGEIESDLRATSDDIAADARRLKAIEDEKGTLAVDDPRLPGLSQEGEDLAAEMAHKTRVESALVAEAQAT
jgi:hypothetical protein